MSQECEDKLTAEDLMYLRVALTLAKANPDLYDMPKTEVALHTLSEKVDRLYKWEVNKE